MTAMRSKKAAGKSCADINCIPVWIRCGRADENIEVVKSETDMSKSAES